MIAYSIEGYISALIIREKHTLLLEGRSDKALICRVLLEMREAGEVDATDLVIDTAELLRGEGVTFGNRVLVEFASQQAKASGIDIMAVTDREFRHFNNTAPIDDLPRHFVDPPSMFWTRGHSMENYFFQPDYFIQFVKHQFPSRVDARAADRIREVFPHVLEWACAVGLALRDSNLLQRAEGIKRANLWEIGLEGKMEFSIENYTNSLRSRSVTSEALDKLSEDIAGYYRTLSNLEDQACLRWLAHGHIGWELLWSGVSAAIASLCEVENDVIQIETGQNETKVNCASTLLATRVIAGEAEMLPVLWDQIRALVPRCKSHAG